MEEGRNTLQPWVNNSLTLNLIVCRKRQLNLGRISLLKRKAQHRRKQIQRKKHGKVKRRAPGSQRRASFFPRESSVADSRCGSSVHTFPIQHRFIVSYVLSGNTKNASNPILSNTLTPAPSLPSLSQTPSIMASNGPTGDNSRKGPTKHRGQIKNPKNRPHDQTQHRYRPIQDLKTTGGKFKGARKEK